MGRYLAEARQHLEKIKYYDAHAGIRGYAQAIYPYSQLCALIKLSGESKNDKNDTSIIMFLKQTADELMNKMKDKRG